jgi:uncharacterized protein (TIGR02145 family)
MKKIFYLLTIAALLIAALTSCNKDVAVTGIKLNETSITLEIGKTKMLIATIFPEDATNKAIKWTSSNIEIATVTNGTVTAKAVGKIDITVTTEDGNYTARCEITVTSVEPEEVGIVINGVRWATRNVNTPGTFTSHHFDAGMFYQWNRKVGWSSTDPIVNCDGGSTWDNSIPIGDSWEPTNDPCPAGWRVPTRTEIESLVGHGEWRVEPAAGYYFLSEDNTLFLPVTGYRDYPEGALLEISSGNYWSSTKESTKIAYSMGFSGGQFGGGFFGTGGNNMPNGFSIRCVAEQ